MEKARVLDSEVAWPSGDEEMINEKSWYLQGEVL